MSFVIPQPLPWPPKDPGEIDDYDINWAPRLVADTILSSAWVITSPSTPSSPPLVITANSFTTQRTKVWLSGGLNGVTYVLQNTVTTAAGDVLIASATLTCRLK